MRARTASISSAAAVTCVLLAAPRAEAQDGAPPPDEKAVVEAPKDEKKAPEIESKVDGTTVTLSAGGMLSTGNSRLFAATANGMFETRFDDNGIGASLLGNYGRTAPPGEDLETTVQNFQGRLRYDRYVIERASLFLINTGRHDRFQGIEFRYNLDPGVKYLFLKEASHSLWAELGYDFQYDIRRDDSRIVLDENDNPVIGPTGEPELLEKTAVDHSIRAFAGYKHAFNKEVTLATGLEYLQSVIDIKRSRLNYDLLFAAKVAGGLAIGFGFTARFDNAPLPAKEKLDTSTTLSLIYSYSDIAEPPTCPCPE